MNYFSILLRILLCASVVDLRVQGKGCLTLDAGFCLAMIDRGLGGPGKIQQKIRPLTIIENLWFHKCCQMYSIRCVFAGMMLQR
ncbi:hypothetical protein [Candidatus Kuenenia stuttgartiensis]|uniref:Uncharacterized protein n=1 Tax=Kuenenia stuttgartiensis TaxID=174633 RepID=A0A2C9CBD0_KUEST|nr:hypothetical protein [Candidatus Kuenenia stuttgartiensis]SOH03094.1 hypothetical protein KSMBR1_0580 [Candidatus Kuenenia stuttgartiensis]